MSATGTTSEEAKIRRLVADWAAALRAKDVGALMSHYDDDVLLYDLAPPLLQRGAALQRKSLEAWLPTFEGPIGFEVRDLQVVAGGDVAYSTSLNRISGARTNGERTDLWVRATVCYRKRGDEWLVAHEHVSTPFYMDGSYKAAVDLEP